MTSTAEEKLADWNDREGELPLGPMDLSMIPEDLNSPGKLSEWIDALPVVNAESREFHPKHVAIGFGTKFLIDDAAAKDAAWRDCVRTAAGIIYAHVADHEKIVWRIRPEFAVDALTKFTPSDDGPDLHPIFDVPGTFVDTGYAAVKCYMRFHVA